MSNTPQGPSQPLYTYFSKTASMCRDDILRTEKNGLIALGVPNPNTGPGSDYYTRATAVGNELAVIHANNVLMADQHMPDTAAGTNLDRWLTLKGLSRRGAIGSYGNTSTQCSAASTSVPGTAQLTDGNGAIYQVAAGGTYATGANGYVVIPVFAVTTGAATNHENGDALQWVNAPPSCGQQAVVGLVGYTDGLTGGFDSEIDNDEPPRQRLLEVMANPPRSGNAADVAGWATQSTPQVQAGFVYPALGASLSPGASYVAVCGQATVLGLLSSTSKNRDLPVPMVTGIVAPYIRGNYPENAQLVITTVANQQNDIALLLSLPPAPTAAPPGPGGGWLDGTPWPSSVGGNACVVEGVTSATVFLVNALTPPSPGVSHIAWLSPLDWQLYMAIVLSYTGTSGAYVITIDTPMIGIAPGGFIFPQSSNQLVYIAATLAAFAGLGPGEWSSSTSVLTRAFRHPRPTTAWPYALDGKFLKQIENSSPEVSGAEFITNFGTTPTVPSAITVDPTSGLLTSAPPNIWVPNNIGLYAA
jgi:hypothetical protein